MVDCALRMIRGAVGFLPRVGRAWRFYCGLHYSWRLAWLKAGYVNSLDEHADVRNAGTR